MWALTVKEDRLQEFEILWDEIERSAGLGDEGLGASHAQK